MKLPEGITDFNELAYITSRKLKNADGENTGTVVMWRKKGDEGVGYKLKCPHRATEQETIERCVQTETVPGAVQQLRQGYSDREAIEKIEKLLSQQRMISFIFAI